MADQKDLLAAARTATERLGRLLDPFLKVAAIVSGGFSLLLLWAAKDDLHLLVMIESDTLVYPSEVTDNLALPLAVNSSPANSARFVKLKIVNYGKQTIGDQTRLAQFDFSSPVGSHLISLHQPTVVPNTIPYDVQQVSQNTLRLQIGALQPRSTIKWPLLLVNATSGTQISLSTSLAGIPREITTETPVIRMAGCMFPWVTLTLFLALAIKGVPAAIAAAKQRPDTPKKDGYLPRKRPTCLVHLRV
jgi:hypothetical protein